MLSSRNEGCDDDKMDWSESMFFSSSLAAIDKLEDSLAILCMLLYSCEDLPRSGCILQKSLAVWDTSAGRWRDF